MFVVIGSTTVDLIVSDRNGAPSPPPADGFRTDNLIFTDTPLTLMMGGNGGNSAYVLASLGADVVLCGAVGLDKMGDILVDWLTDRGVNLEGLRRTKRHATSTSVILMADATSQMVYHHLGATETIAPDTIPEHLLADADALLYTGYPLLDRMRPAGVAHALATVRQAGGVTALDIGPSLRAPVTLDELRPMLADIDYFIANIHELAMLSGQEDWEVTSAQLLDGGAHHVVIKRGRDGVSMRGQDVQADMPAFDVQANISVGAGDSFNAAFLYAVQRGWPLEQALHFGSATAALVISGKRGVLGAPALAQVQDFLRAEIGEIED